MQIINIIRLENGNTHSVKSFVIQNEKECRTKAIETAENCFVEKVKEVTGKDYTMEQAEEDDFIFDDLDGSEVILNWSDEIEIF